MNYRVLHDWYHPNLEGFFDHLGNMLPVRRINLSAPQNRERTTDIETIQNQKKTSFEAKLQAVLEYAKMTKSQKWLNWFVRVLMQTGMTEAECVCIRRQDVTAEQKEQVGIIYLHREADSNLPERIVFVSYDLACEMLTETEPDSHYILGGSSGTHREVWQVIEVFGRACRAANITGLTVWEIRQHFENVAVVMNLSEYAKHVVGRATSLQYMPKSEAAAIYRKMLPRLTLSEDVYAGTGC